MKTTSCLSFYDLSKFFALNPTKLYYTVAPTQLDKHISRAALPMATHSPLSSAMSSEPDFSAHSFSLGFRASSFSFSSSSPTFTSGGSEDLPKFVRCYKMFTVLFRWASRITFADFLKFMFADRETLFKNALSWTV
jgi:hypothetical protein